MSEIYEVIKKIVEAMDDETFSLWRRAIKERERKMRAKQRDDLD